MSGNTTNGGELILYVTEDGRNHVECRFVGETLWLTQAGMAELFQTTPQNITQHLRAIYSEGELSPEATCKEHLQVRSEGSRSVERTLKHYSLDAVLAVGYRVRSVRGTQFRRWAFDASLKETGVCWTNGYPCGLEVGRCQDDVGQGGEAARVGWVASDFCDSGEGGVV